MNKKPFDIDDIIANPVCSDARNAKDDPLRALVKHISNPDDPITSASNLVTLRSMGGIAPSKMYEDKGHKLRVVKYIAHKGMTTPRPKTVEAMNVELLNFLTFCEETYTPPTFGLFAIWCGSTVQTFNSVKPVDDVYRGIQFAKDCIRNFIEVSAMEGSVNPIVYFHQNKVYYGAVENVNINVTTEDNTSEISPDEYNERVLLLTRNKDGVYSSEE
jgi:hypothetical protein